MSTENDELELISAMSYHPDTGLHLLPLHLDRIRAAHKAIANESPESWCAHKPCPKSQAMISALEGAVSGREGLQRVSRSRGLPNREVGNRQGFGAD